MHDGVDIVNSEKTAVNATADGIIIKADYDKAKGITVIIEHNNNWQTEYRHLSKLVVEEGQAVKSGALIGLMGSTGQSTGTHLHFSIVKNGQYTDPAALLENKN
nr:M23 family metallopeptidase [Paenibacillus sp. FJAT-27812]